MKRAALAEDTVTPTGGLAAAAKAMAMGTGLAAGVGEKSGDAAAGVAASAPAAPTVAVTRRNIPEPPSTAADARAASATLQREPSVATTAAANTRSRKVTSRILHRTSVTSAETANQRMVGQRMGATQVAPRLKKLHVLPAGQRADNDQVLDVLKLFMREKKVIHPSMAFRVPLDYCAASSVKSHLPDTQDKAAGAPLATCRSASALHLPSASSSSSGLLNLRATRTAELLLWPSFSSALPVASASAITGRCASAVSSSPMETSSSTSPSSRSSVSFSSPCDFSASVSCSFPSTCSAASSVKKGSSPSVRLTPSTTYVVVDCSPTSGILTADTLVYLSGSPLQRLRRVQLMALVHPNSAYGRRAGICSYQQVFDKRFDFPCLEEENQPLLREAPAQVRDFDLSSETADVAAVVGEEAEEVDAAASAGRAEWRWTEDENKGEGEANKEDNIDKQEGGKAASTATRRPRNTTGDAVVTKTRDRAAVPLIAAESRRVAGAEVHGETERRILGNGKETNIFKGENLLRSAGVAAKEEQRYRQPQQDCFLNKGTSVAGRTLYTTREQCTVSSAADSQAEEAAAAGPFDVAQNTSGEGATSGRRPIHAALASSAAGALNITGLAAAADGARADAWNTPPREESVHKEATALLADFYSDRCEPQLTSCVRTICRLHSAAAVPRSSSEGSRDPLLDRCRRVSRADFSSSGVERRGTRRRSASSSQAGAGDAREGKRAGSDSGNTKRSSSSDKTSNGDKTSGRGFIIGSSESAFRLKESDVARISNDSSSREVGLGSSEIGVSSSELGCKSSRRHQSAGGCAAEVFSCRLTTPHQLCRSRGDVSPCQCGRSGSGGRRGFTMVASSASQRGLLGRSSSSSGNASDFTSVQRDRGGCGERGKTAFFKVVEEECDEVTANEAGRSLRFDFTRAAPDNSCETFFVESEGDDARQGPHMCCALCGRQHATTRARRLHQLQEAVLLQQMRRTPRIRRWREAGESLPESTSVGNTARHHTGEICEMEDKSPDIAVERRALHAGARGVRRARGGGAAGEGEDAATAAAGHRKPGRQVIHSESWAGRGEGAAGERRRGRSHGRYAADAAATEAEVLAVGKRNAAAGKGAPLETGATAAAGGGGPSQVLADRQWGVRRLCETGEGGMKRLDAETLFRDFVGPYLRRKMGKRCSRSERENREGGAAVSLRKEVEEGRRGGKRIQVEDSRLQDGEGAGRTDRTDREEEEERGKEADRWKSERSSEAEARKNLREGQHNQTKGSLVLYVGKELVIKNVTFVVWATDPAGAPGLLDEDTVIYICLDPYGEYRRLHFVPFIDTLPTTYAFDFYEDCLKLFLLENKWRNFRRGDVFSFRGVEFKLIATEPSSSVGARVGPATVVYHEGSMQPSVMDVLPADVLYHIRRLPARMQPAAIIFAAQRLDPEVLMRVVPASSTLRSRRGLNEQTTETLREKLVEPFSFAAYFKKHPHLCYRILPTATERSANDDCRPGAETAIRHQGQKSTSTTERPAATFDAGQGGGSDYIGKEGSSHIVLHTPQQGQEEHKGRAIVSSVSSASAGAQLRGFVGDGRELEKCRAAGVRQPKPNDLARNVFHSGVKSFPREARESAFDARASDSQGNVDDVEDIHNFERPSCTVCTLFMEEKDASILLFCGHVFHWQCIQLWLRYNSTCPNCRAEITDLCRQHEESLRRERLTNANQRQEYERERVEDEAGEEDAFGVVDSVRRWLSNAVFGT